MFSRWHVLMAGRLALAVGGKLGWGQGWGCSFFFCEGAFSMGCWDFSVLSGVQSRMDISSYFPCKVLSTPIMLTLDTEEHVLFLEVAGDRSRPPSVWSDNAGNHLWSTIPSQAVQELLTMTSLLLTPNMPGGQETRPFQQYPCGTRFPKEGGNNVPCFTSSS